MDEEQSKRIIKKMVITQLMMCLGLLIICVSLSMISRTLNDCEKHLKKIEHYQWMNDFRNRPM